MFNQIPEFFDKSKVDQIYQIDYQKRTKDAREWKKQFGAKSSNKNICLLIIDQQVDFAIPTGALYVPGAVDNSIRLCDYIYRNINDISSIHLSLDSHFVNSIFFESFWVNQDGEHPSPMTIISADDVRNNIWKFNGPNIEGFNNQILQKYVLDYVETLERNFNLQLIVWNYHCLLGSLGGCLVPAVEEAVFFHSIFTETNPNIILKGMNRFTEQYNIFSPEVCNDFNGGKKNMDLVYNLLENDIIIVCGEAKNYCVLSSLQVLVNEAIQISKSLAGNIFVLNDCTSQIGDFTEQTNKAFEKLQDYGVHLISTENSIEELIDEYIR